MKNNEQHTIYQDSFFDKEEDYRDAYACGRADEAEDEDDYESDFYDWYRREKEAEFDAEQMNLDRLYYPNGIIVIVSLGLWNGRRLGYAREDEDSVVGCLTGCGEGEKRFYVEGNDFKCVAVHHDGRNHFVFRKWREWVSEDQKDALRSALYNNDEDKARRLSNLYTEGLGKDIGQVYGW